MNKVAITVSALALTAVLAGACSNSSDSEKPHTLDEGAGGGDGRADSGGEDFSDAGEDANRDGGITDARDELVPIDASRGDSGALDDAGGDEDASPEPDCIFDDDCGDKVSVGVCERATCSSGSCVVVWAALGSTCDDGLECSSGGLCEDGVCIAGKPDVTNPDCVENDLRNVVWITEIMGRPRAIDGAVDVVEGQWIEIVSLGSKEVHLHGARFVYYEWPAGEAEPLVPEYSAYLMGDASLSPRDTLLLTRSFEPHLNGGLRPVFAYENAFQFRGDRDARLTLVTAEWTKDANLPIGELPSGPIDAEYIIDSVYIPAGTFGEANQGRSWQVGVPLPEPSNPDARVFCYTPAEASNAYVEEGELKNYGTPGATNVGCGP